MKSASKSALPWGELLAFLASAAAGLGVLWRRPAPLPEVQPGNGAEAVAVMPDLKPPTAL